MGVKVRAFTLGGAPPQVTTFTDPLTGASGDLGLNWIGNNHPFTPFATPFGFTQIQIGAVAFDGLQGLVMSYFGQANPVWAANMMMFPTPVYEVLKSVAQFSEMQIVSEVNANANNRGGVSVFGQPLYSTLTGYALEASNGTLGLFRYGGAAPAVLVNPIAGGFTNLDLLRLTIQPQATQNVLTVTKNGTVIQTFTDNNAGRHIVGSPSIYCLNINPPAAPAGLLNWRNYKAGPG